MKPMFETSTDVQKCCDFLANKDRASYAEISHHLGRKVNSPHDRHVLESARRRLEKQQGVVFVVERGIGIVRATNGQVATLATTHPIGKIKRLTRKAKKRQGRVNVQELTADERLAFTIGRAILSAVDQTTLKSLRSRLAKEIEKRDGELVTINQVFALPRHRGKGG
jgi:hypothetical protein